MTSPFQPVLKQDLGEVVYQRIKLALMQSRLKPNDKLVIRKLSEEMGLSMTPIREALLRLVSENVLVLDTRGTAMVPELDYETFVAIYDLRVDLESKAAVQAVSNATKDDITELERIHGDMFRAQKMQELDRARELNAVFHETYCSLSKSPILISFISTLWMRCGPLMAHIHRNGPQQWKDDIHPHTTLIAGLKEKDEAKIREAVRYDILHGGRELLAYVRENAQSETQAASILD
jgi:DNA-binding GntR family transcriptional regulator